MRREPPLLKKTIAEGASGLQHCPRNGQMSDITTTTERQATGLAQRPKRADARRNYEALLAAAAEAFTENGNAASLEDIARRRGVGIATLSRHFPTRQALLEPVYVDEVEEMSAKANDLGDLEPWD